MAFFHFPGFFHRAVPAALLALAAGAAHAGWYQVRNYTGTVGSASVHVSLQTYGALDHGQPEEWHVQGSYYYDSHRLPIPLEGKRTADGHMTLCEAAAPASSSESPQVPPATSAHPVPCPLALSVSNDGATGEWNDGKHVLPVALRQVGRLDDSGATGSPLQGSVEIPMWFHTPTDLLLGIYETSADCPVSMLRLRLVNLRTGQVDGEVPLRCDAGMVMTPIYANVSRSDRGRHVTVGFQGGRMGSDEDIDIGPKALRRP